MKAYPEPKDSSKMVVLHLTPIPPTVSCHLSSTRLTSALTSNAFSRVHKKSVQLQTGFFSGIQIQVPNVLKQRGLMVVKASAEIDGAGETTVPSPTPSESNDESLPVEELPLESKLQMKLDQKIKMKLAKKLRMRRKRLVRKRQLRKKGRWPPSKMKKNKNV